MAPQDDLVIQQDWEAYGEAEHAAKTAEQTRAAVSPEAALASAARETTAAGLHDA